MVEPIWEAGDIAYYAMKLKKPGEPIDAGIFVRQFPLKMRWRCDLYEFVDVTVYVKHISYIHVFHDDGAMLHFNRQRRIGGFRR